MTTAACAALSKRSAGSSAFMGMTLLPKLRPLLDGTKERQLVISPLRFHCFFMGSSFAKLCRSDEGVAGFDSGFHEAFSLFDSMLCSKWVILESFLKQNTKPGFLAEIRALAFAAAGRRWLTPCLAPTRIFEHPVSVHGQGVDSHDRTLYRKTVFHWLSC